MNTNAASHDFSDALSRLDPLSDCAICPRECHVNRLAGQIGTCRAGGGLAIASICAHRGEEPVVSGDHGICNIFFAGCNMGCGYCQNCQISRASYVAPATPAELASVIGQIEQILNSGATGVGFVSPSHCIPQMKTIMAALDIIGRRPTYVYNTNSYDRVETIRDLEGKIEVWLPDMKYATNELAEAYSATPDYAPTARAAITEMFRQVGPDLELHADGTIERGLIIRHLVLPGNVENSIEVLRWIAEHLSVDIHISLMSQYFPTDSVKNHPPLNRTLRPEEYEAVRDEFERLGFHRGWVQEMQSADSYRPDFDQSHPFE